MTVLYDTAAVQWGFGKVRESSVAHLRRSRQKLQPGLMTAPLACVML